MVERTHKVARLDCAKAGLEATPGAFARKGWIHSRGEHTFKVKKSLHEENRSKLILRMRTLRREQSEVPTWLVFRGGVSRERNDSDREELFRQESFFQYLFGVKVAFKDQAIHYATKCRSLIGTVQSRFGAEPAACSLQSYQLPTLCGWVGLRREKN